MACYDRNLTRRQMLGRGIGLGVTLYGARALPIFRVLENAESAAAAAAPNAPILVSVFLPGGCDLLGTLTPLDQLGKLADLRRTLKLDDSLPRLAGASSIAINPALTKGLGGGIAGLFGEGKIGFLPGIDYAKPDLSHFHSRHFWETGIVSEGPGPGWLGRWLDKHGNADNPLQGLSLDGSLSPVLRSAVAPVAAVSSPGDAALEFAGTWGIGAEKAADAWERLAALPRSGPGPLAAGRAARLTQQVGTLLAPFAQTEDKVGNKADPVASPVAYPPKSDFADSLRNLAGLLDAPLGIRVASVDAPGDFDTHDDQPAELTSALTEVSEGLAAFQADLEARGIADRVLTFVWSEFGRRPQSNDSQGTDHGAGGIAWVQGTRAKGGILSDMPDVTKLDHDENLQVTLDFRRVYASLLEGWMGTDAADVLPGARSAGRLELVR